MRGCVDDLGMSGVNGRFNGSRVPLCATAGNNTLSKGVGRLGLLAVFSTVQYGPPARTSSKSVGAGAPTSPPRSVRTCITCTVVGIRARLGGRR